MKKVILCGFLGTCMALLGCAPVTRAVKYKAIIVDEYTNKPVANLPAQFVQVATSYLDKDIFVQNATSNANGEIVIDNKLKVSKFYSLDVNVHEGVCKGDTSKIEFQYLATGMQKSAVNFDGVTETIKIKPSGFIRFLAADSIYTKYNTTNFIVEGDGNRISITNALDWPAAISGFEAKGAIEGNTMYFTPNISRTFKIYAVQNGSPVLLYNKTLVVKNAFSGETVSGCFGAMEVEIL
jgi:hypothetical protein